MASGQMENHNYDITCARFSGLCLSLFRLKKDTKMTPIFLLREDSLAEGMTRRRKKRQKDDSRGA